MAVLRIRNLDDRVVAALKRRANAGHRTIEEEARRILAETVNADDNGYWERLKRHRLARGGGKILSDSVELIRAGRSERMRRLLGKK